MHAYLASNRARIDNAPHMGFYFRKSFRAGPIRFNLSKSGVGVSTGVKGLRIGTGPRGAYIAGGRKGLYFRQNLSATDKSKTNTSASANVATNTIAGSGGQQAGSPEYVAAPSAGGFTWPIIIGLFGIFFIAAGINDTAPIAIALGIFCLLCSVALGTRRAKKIEKYRQYDILLAKIADSPDEAALQAITTLSQVGTFNSGAWDRRRRFIYTQLVQDVVENGIEEPEPSWIERVRTALKIGEVSGIHLDIVRPLLWQAMADGTVTAEEETAINELLKQLDLAWSDLPEERDAFDQFVRGRLIQAGELPILEADINLQRNEVCHHATYGAFLESKVVRTYTVDGQRHKDEALTTIKEGNIYITSKRVLMVADGTSSIPHEKVLDIEIDADKKLITLIKDGRQKPLFIQTPDAIYTGILLEHLSTT